MTTATKHGVLVLSRRAGEEVYLDDAIVVQVHRIHGNTVKLAIRAPRDIPVHRGEIAAYPTRERDPSQTEGMLILSRKVGEEVVMGDGFIVVRVTKIHGNQVKLAFSAPRHVTVFRGELKKQYQVQ